EQRIAEDARENLARRDLEHVLIQIVVVQNLPQELLEIVALPRKGTSDLAFEQANVVIESQANAGKGNRGTELRGQRKIFPRQAKLPQQPDQRPLPGP